MTARPGDSRPSPQQLPGYVGRYRVLDRVGRGAMGVVYAALDEPLNRRVAVKLMLGDFDQEPELRERFAREGRITGQLAHRNIVTVFDLGEDQGRPFIVMELLESSAARVPPDAGGTKPRGEDRFDDAGLRWTAERPRLRRHSPRHQAQ